MRMSSSQIECLRFANPNQYSFFQKWKQQADFFNLRFLRLKLFIFWFLFYNSKSLDQKLIVKLFKLEAQLFFNYPLLNQMLNDSE